MKNKIYYIIYSIISILISLYSIVSAKMINKNLLESLDELKNILPSSYFDKIVQMYSNYGEYIIVVPSIIVIIICCIILYNTINEVLIKNKSLITVLLVITFLISPNLYINILSIVSLVLLLTDKSKYDENAKEKKQLPIIKYSKKSNKEKITSLILLLIYFSQIPIGYILPDIKLLTWIVRISYQIILLILVIYFFYDELKKNFKLFKDNFKRYVSYLLPKYGIGLLLLILTGTIAMFITNQGQSINQLLLEEQPILYLIPIAIIWAPIVEELLFRGYLRRFFNNNLVFIIVSALLFGLIHSISEESLLNIIVMTLPYASLGGILAYVYTKTNNICSSMFIHMLHNTIAIFIMILI